MINKLPKEKVNNKITFKIASKRIKSIRINRNQGGEGIAP
jgi:hypothetical protein